MTLDPATCWQALCARDRTADGTFVYGVLTTTIYCRPSCPSRQPNRDNVRFFAVPAEAETAGYRPCKRCTPQHARPPAAELVARAAPLLLADPRPTNAQVAAQLGLSSAAFLRRFKAVTGVTPQRYRRRVLAERARAALPTAEQVADASARAGYSAPSRFYDTVGRELGMDPAKARAGGRGEQVHHVVASCSLGRVLVAWTDRGVCRVTLGDDDEALRHELVAALPHAEHGRSEASPYLQALLAGIDEGRAVDLPLDLRGTAFQERVWQALRTIPRGDTWSYAELAASVGSGPRAVASACAANAVAIAVPCHRVVRSDGTLSGYRWGVERKAALLAREATATQQQQPASQERDGAR